jgi:hypothetical protein
VPAQNAMTKATTGTGLLPYISEMEPSDPARGGAASCRSAGARCRAPGVQETRVNINLDGYRLGEAVAYHVARANQHVAAAAQFDAGAMHMPGDLETA